MLLPTYPLTVDLRAPTADSPLVGARVVAVLDRTETDGSGYVVQRRIEAQTDRRGVAVLSLWPNTRGSGQSRYVLFAIDARNETLFEVYLVMPERAARAAEVAGPPIAADVPLDEQLRAEIQIMRADIMAARGMAADAAKGAASSAKTAREAAGKISESVDSVLSELRVLRSQVQDLIGESRSQALDDIESALLNARDAITTLQSKAAASGQSIIDEIDQSKAGIESARQQGVAAIESALTSAKQALSVSQESLRQAVADMRDAVADDASATAADREAVSQLRKATAADADSVAGDRQAVSSTAESALADIDQALTAALASLQQSQADLHDATEQLRDDAVESERLAGQYASSAEDSAETASAARSGIVDARDRAEAAATSLEQLIIENQSLRETVDTEHGRPLVRSGRLLPRAMFARGSVAWAYGSDGVLRQFDVNEPRLEYDPATLDPLGVLIEGQDTNIVESHFSDSHWSTQGKVSVEETEIKSPAGGFAKRLRIQTGSASSWSDKLNTSFSPKTQYPAMRAIAMSEGARYLGFVTSSSTGIQSTTYFDFQEKKIITNGHPSAEKKRDGDAYMRDLGDGWVECVAQRQRVYRDFAVTAFDSISGVYDRDISGSPDNTMLIDCGTLQDRARSSPIMSDGGAVTRDADSLTAAYGAWQPNGRHTWYGLVRMPFNTSEGPTVIGLRQSRVYASGRRLALFGNGKLWQPAGDHQPGNMVPFYWTVDFDDQADVSIGKSAYDSLYLNSAIADLIVYPRAIPSFEITRELSL